MSERERESVTGSTGEQSAATRCELGHTQKAMECPACSGSDDLAHWRWYRSRTSSKRIKALIDTHMHDLRATGPETGTGAGRTARKADTGAVFHPASGPTPRLCSCPTPDHCKARTRTPDETPGCRLAKPERTKARIEFTTVDEHAQLIRIALRKLDPFDEDGQAASEALGSLLYFARKEANRG
jgi:hypothetical protein